MGNLIPALFVLLEVQRARWRRAADEGVSTLEMVIIALGLVVVAGILVTAITRAVSSRTDQLQ